MIWKFKFLLIPLLYLFSFSEAQPITLNLKKLTSENGLSDNQVTCILKDPLGFMWVGTKNGLNRFDGREFYVFKHDDHNSSSLGGNNITCLEMDDDSILWIGTASSGFCSYNFKNGKFTNYHNNNSTLSSNSINDIAFDKSRKKLWIAYNNRGLQTFDLKKSRLDTGSYAANTFYDVLIKDNNVYLAGINRSLSWLKTVNNKLNNGSDHASTLNKIFLSRGIRILAGAWDNGLHEFDNTTKRINTFIFDGTSSLNKSGNEIISLAEDNDNILWCGTKLTGVKFFDLKTNTFQQKYNLPGVNSRRITYLYHDDKNRMWIGTEVGLFIYDPIGNLFQITYLPVPQNSPQCKVYDKLYLHNGTEIIVSECGMFYKKITDLEYQHKDLFYRGEKQQLFSIFRDYKNRIYVGSNKSLFFLDTVSFTISSMYCYPSIYNEGFNSIVSSRINSITQIKRNADTLVLASVYGHTPYIIHPENKNVCMMIGQSKKKDDFIDNLTRKLFVDSKNNLWICGALQGITQVFIPDSLNIDLFPSYQPTLPKIYFDYKTWGKQAPVKSSPITNVYDIVENNDNTYWITTQGSGLIKFFPDNKTKSFISFANQYKSLQGIIKTDESNLWITSSNGLINYNIKNNRYKLYDKSNGITENIGGYFFSPNPFKNDNLVSAGFDGGFISFNPEQIVADTEKPIVKITRLWVLDSPSDSLLFSPLKLAYLQNFLKFYISANNFTNNEQTTYLYFLEGIDKKWRDNQNNPLITYTNLPHGDYTLRIKAINSDGLESDELSYSIVITPPFYKTYWFYFFIALFIGSTIYALYKYRIKQFLKLQEVRNKIARDLHDDIGSTLGSIHLYSQIAAKKIDEHNHEGTRLILERIEKSSGEIIDKTSDAVWAVKASNDTIENLFLRMEGYAASLLGEAGIQFTLECKKELMLTKLTMDHRKNLFLVYKEAIHNIIKYSQCNQVHIEITKQLHQIKLKITDDGIGFKLDHIHPYNGNGLKNMKERAEEMKGKFTISSTPGAGTTVEFII
jgi:signal transduction histidine kinase/streptogramin lyase